MKQCYRDKTRQGSRQLSRFIMYVLLAESKTMLSDQSEIADNELKSRLPVFEEIADKEMGFITSLKPDEIAEILGISQNLATKCLSYAYDFPNKTTGYSALKGFIGEAYRGLDASTLSAKALEAANSNLIIISSLYGLLKPSDIIKPYRLEFNKPIYPDRKSAIKIYKQKATIEFVRRIKAEDKKEIIDLLPADADSMLDWKIIRAFAKVYKIRFQTIDSNGKLKTPLAKRLKELRGMMCRQILEEGLTEFSQLKDIQSSHFIYSEDDSKEGMPVFIATE